MAAAHPHVFVQTGVHLLHGADGRLEAVRVTWTYDELFSLLLLEDLGLDADHDGRLTEAELAALQGFDLDWPADFEGDIYLTAGEVPLALGAPEPGPARLAEDGRLVSSHLRRLAEPVDPRAAPVVLRAYDPYFYTAYEIIVAEVATDAPGCIAEVYAPDLDTAYAELEAALAELMGQSATADTEIDFPPVGDRFAEEVRLTCTGGG
jgi:ABC-type uncharacterized transport system substrate-binding protein